MTVTLDVPRAVTRSGLDLFLQKLLWESDSVNSSGPPLSIIRLKVGFVWYQHLLLIRYLENIVHFMGCI